MTFTVIITDDDPVTLFMHNRLVKRSGLSETPINFSTAKETLDYLDKFKGSGRVFLILLDINMPEISGWELLDRIDEKKHKNIYAVIVSSSVNIVDYEKADSYKQVLGFIEKPLSEGKIQTLTESKRYQSACKIQL